MNGAAARIQGYVARDGFGITRIMNQMVEANPVTIKKTFVLFILLWHFCLFIM